jgi:hypothetical protein
MFSKPGTLGAFTARSSILRLAVAVLVGFAGGLLLSSFKAPPHINFDMKSQYNDTVGRVPGYIPLLTSRHCCACVKTHPVDGSRYRPRNQPDTREWRQPPS